MRHLAERAVAALKVRTLIIGNSGSGKTTLAQPLGLKFGIPTIDLDSVFWEGEGYGRDKRIASQMVCEVAAAELWRIELLVWTDLSWNEWKAGHCRRLVQFKIL